MRNILVPFLIGSILLGYLPAGSEREGAAKDIFHTFVIGVYFFPLLGGWLADRYFGKYNTVLWFSVLYCIGEFMLVGFSDNRIGFLAGLGIIPLGSGGAEQREPSLMRDRVEQSHR